MSNMVIKTKIMKKLVSGAITKLLKDKFDDQNADVKIDELEIEIGKVPRLHMKIEADVSIKDIIEVIKDED